MRAVDLIRKKRDGDALDRREIHSFIAGVTAGDVPDYQAAAMLMAIVLRGMTPDETVWLTEAMIGSGATVDLSAIPGPKADKHSTGGVGDKTSIVVAPLAAACGLSVPMMSGRGLGHTGGTLDKLEAIPGFRTGLALDDFVRVVRDVGCAIVGQTSEIVPADRTLYALRDVTATVDSVPLISASIMSKKIAEGIDALVLDVKCGRGAFMKTEADAAHLAESLVAIGSLRGVRTEALITSMDAPLGRAVGNALEVAEAIETLGGRGPSDVETLCLALTARMLVLAGLMPGAAEAERLARDALGSGAALARFIRMVEAQGGDTRVVDDPRRLPAAPGRATVDAPSDGFLAVVDARRVGEAVVLLGAGRARANQAIDPSVGAVVLRRPGERVHKGEPVLELHYRDDASLSAAFPVAASAIGVDDGAAPIPPLVLREVR